MTAETVEMFEQGDARPQLFNELSMRDYLASYLSLTDAQRVTGLNIRRFQSFHDNRLVNEGTRLSFGVIGVDVENAHHSWDLIDGENQLSQEANDFLLREALKPVDQEITTWIGYVGTRQVISAPLPSLQVLTSSHRGW